MCVSLLLDIFCRLGVSGLHTVRTLIKITCQKLLITICRTYMAVRTSGYITFFICTPVGNTGIQQFEAALIHANRWTDGRTRRSQ